MCLEFEGTVEKRVTVFRLFLYGIRGPRERARSTYVLHTYLIVCFVLHSVLTSVKVTTDE